MPSPLPDGPGIIRGETGAQTLLGYVVDIRDGTARCHLDLGPEHGNRHGLLHGGIMSCLLDNVMGFAAVLSFDPTATARVLTLTMTTHYLGNVGTGRVTGTGKVTGGGRKTIFAEATLCDAHDQILATGTGVYKRVADRS